jgi:hypothetical protein
MVAKLKKALFAAIAVFFTIATGFAVAPETVEKLSCQYVGAGCPAAVSTQVTK